MHNVHILTRNSFSQSCGIQHSQTSSFNVGLCMEQESALFLTQQFLSSCHSVSANHIPWPPITPNNIVYMWSRNTLLTGVIVHLMKMAKWENISHHTFSHLLPLHPKSEELIFVFTHYELFAQHCTRILRCKPCMPANVADRAPCQQLVMNNNKSLGRGTFLCLHIMKYSHSAVYVFAVQAMHASKCCQ